MEIHIEDITDWAIENKVKLKFSDKYDDNVKEDKFLSSNYNKDDVIAQGTVVEIVISKGQLKMMSFDSFSSFREWADKYGIQYEEQHEFSDTVKAGEVISYSYKKGDTIKNNDVVIVKISDGTKIIVPDLNGLTKLLVCATMLYVIWNIK